MNTRSPLLTIIIAPLLIALAITAPGCSAFGAADEDDDTTSLALLALAAVANQSGDNPNCGIVDNGTSLSAIPAIVPTTAVRSVQFANSGANYYGVVLLSNVSAGAIFTVSYPNGAAGGQSAYNDFTCPIDQGAGNADTVAASKVQTGAQGATSQTFSIVESGSYSLVFTYLTADPGTTITIQKTN